MNNSEPRRRTWRDLDRLPQRSGEGWSRWKKGRVTTWSPNAMLRWAARWQPNDLTLVAGPHQRAFAPPVRSQPLRASILATTRRNGIRSIAFWTLMTLVFAFLPNSFGGASRIGLPIVFALAGFFTAYDLLVVLQSPRAVLERSLFLYWLHQNPSARNAFVAAAILLVGCGAGQLALAQISGDSDTAIMRFGLYFPDVGPSQIWRFVTGPYFHSNPMHFIGNALLLMVLAAPAWATLRVWALAAFLIGNTLGGLSEYVMRDGQHDAYTGISGGLFALLGLLICAAWRSPRSLPLGSRSLFLGVLLISGLGAPLMSPNASIWGHLSGALTGALLGLGMPRNHLLRKHPTAHPTTHPTAL